MGNNSLKIAVIDPNTLAAVGLKAMLQDVMPIADVETFGTIAELEANHANDFIHYFVAVNVVLRNKDYFGQRQHKTIVLTQSIDNDKQLCGFHCLCVNVPEKQLVRALLSLEQQAHAHGRNLPTMEHSPRPTLTSRETEVMVLIVQGLINKEIADKLGIGLATVITHRKNIMDKLHIKSVSALTIYAVMNGYVDINKI